MEQIEYSNHLESLAENLKENIFFSSFSKENQLFSHEVVVPSYEVKRWLERLFIDDPSLGISMGIRWVFLPNFSEYLEEEFFPEEKKSFTSFEIHLALEEKIRKLFEKEQELSFEEKKLYAPLFRYLGTTLNPLHLFSLCEDLSMLFLRYELVGGGEKIFSDKEESALFWQKALWRDLFLQKESRRGLREKFHQGPSAPFKKRILHLFHLPFLPAIFHQLFEKLSGKISLIHYVLSPCRMFWEDLLSSKEQNKARRYWERKGISEKSLENLQLFWEDSHPLLGNWGKVGREREKIFSERDLTSHENYKAKGASLLELLQKDLLDLQNPEERKPLVISEEDFSLEIVEASSPLREVEALFEAIARRIFLSQKTEKPLAPSDFLVLSPKMERYLPFLPLVFQGEKTALSLDLSGQRIGQGSFFAQALLSLEKEKRENLLENPLFLGKEETLVMFEEELKELKKASLSLGGWTEALSSFVEKYFSLEKEEEKAVERLFQNFLFRLQKAEQEFSQTLYSFSFIFFLWKKELEKRKRESAFSWQSISFTSLEIGHSTPAKCIALLGMEDGFPSSDFISSLDLSASKKGDFLPSLHDKERYSFLEALLNARKSLYISFVAIAPSDAKRQEVSCLVQELITYCESAYVLEGKTMREHLFKKLSPFSFHRENFLTTSFSQASFEKAKAYYSKKEKTSPTCERSFPQKEAFSKTEARIDLKELSFFSLHPLRFYCQKVLGLHLEEEKKEEENFLLLPWERAKIRRMALQSPLGEILNHFEEIKKNSSFLFSERRKREIQKEVEEVEANLRLFSLRKEEIFSVNFLKASEGKVEKRIHCELSPLEIPGGFHLVGELEGLSPRGLILWERSSSLWSWIREWPKILTFLHLSQAPFQEKWRIPALVPKILWLRKGKEEEIPWQGEELLLLSRFLRYYQKAKREPFFLFERWQEDVLSEKELSSTFSIKESSFSPAFEDPYLRYLFSFSEKAFDCASISRWHKELCEVFAPLKLLKTVKKEEKNG